MPLDPTDPVMAAWHAVMIQGGYTTPAIEAGRMKAGCKDASHAQLVTWATQAGLPTDGTREDVLRRLHNRIDERLAAYQGEERTHE